MSSNQLKHELQNILSGKGQVSHGTFIQTIARYLRAGTPTGPMAQEDQHHKRKETEKLTAYIEQHNHWVKNINFSDFISEMENNGFENTRNHDYYNPELGIILEDLHDENVLTQNGMLYFIDTVFYVKPEVLWS